MLKDWINRLFEIKCSFCGLPIKDEYHFLCPACRDNLQTIEATSGNHCQICDATLYECACNLCYDCHRSDRLFQQNRSIFYYRLEAIRYLVGLFKFESNKAAGRELAYLLKPHLSAYFERNRFDWVTAVPLSVDSFRKRGFNQVESILDICQIPYERILKRRIHSRKQSELSAEERRILISGQFEVDPAWQKSLENKTVLVVDDILTTGSTLNEISRVLLNGGASQVWGLTFFRD